MYIKFENREQGKKFTFFTRKKRIAGQLVDHTDKSVFATLSESIKIGNDNGHGQPVWQNDYWNAVFCGKAYEKAIALADKDRIRVVEMSVRNEYNKDTKKSYPMIAVTDFDIISTGAGNRGDGFINIPDNIGEELPFV